MSESKRIWSPYHRWTSLHSISRSCSVTDFIVYIYFLKLLCKIISFLKLFLSVIFYLKFYNITNIQGNWKEALVEMYFVVLSKIRWIQIYSRYLKIENSKNSTFYHLLTYHDHLNLFDKHNYKSINFLSVDI